MPLPGDNLKVIGEILTKAIKKLSRMPESNDVRETIRKLIFQASDLLESEEMDVVRFGDVTRIVDHTFEPYQTIKKTISALGDVDIKDRDDHVEGDEELEDDDLEQLEEQRDLLEYAAGILTKFLETDAYDLIVKTS